MIDKELLNKAKKKLKSPDIIVEAYTLDIVWASNSYAKAGGYTPGELTGANLTAHTPCISEKEFKKLRDYTIENQTGTVKIELQNKAKQKALVTFEFRIVKHKSDPFMVLKAKEIEMIKDPVK